MWLPSFERLKICHGRGHCTPLHRFIIYKNVNSLRITTNNKRIFKCLYARYSSLNQNSRNGDMNSIKYQVFL